MFGFGKRKPVEVVRVEKPVHYHKWRSAGLAGPIEISLCVLPGCEGLRMAVTNEAKERVRAEWLAEQAKSHPGPLLKVDAEVKKRPKQKPRRRDRDYADDEYD